MKFESLYWLANELMAELNEIQKERIDILCKENKPLPNETQQEHRRRMSKDSLWLGLCHTHSKFGELIEKNISEYRRKSDVINAREKLFHEFCEIISVDSKKVYSITRQIDKWYKQSNWNKSFPFDKYNEQILKLVEFDKSNEQ